MAVLNWLEATGLSTWVREGESIWAFPTILTLHTFGLGLLVGANTHRRPAPARDRPPHAARAAAAAVQRHVGRVLAQRRDRIAAVRGRCHRARHVAVLPVEARVRGDRRRGDGRDQTIRVRRAAGRAHRFSEADGAGVAGRLDGGDHDRAACSPTCNKDRRHVLRNQHSASAPPAQSRADRRAPSSGLACCFSRWCGATTISCTPASKCCLPWRC